MFQFDLPHFYLVFSALFLGGLCGWQLAHWFESTQRRGASSALKAEPKREAAQKAPDSELTDLRTRLATLDEQIAEARKRVQQRDDEYATLILELDSQQALLDETRAERRRPSASASPADQLVHSLDADQQEIDLLTQIHETNRLKINKLTQMLQWQDSELQLMREATLRKDAEIEEARALVDQREVDLRRLIRQRQQREQDLSHARAELTQMEQSLQEAAALRAAARSVPAVAPVLDLPAQPTRPALPSEVAFSRSDCSQRPPDWEDDFTRISGLLPFYADQLKARGLRTFCDLACLSVADLEALLQIPGHYSPDLPAWIQAAGLLAREGRSI